MSSAGGLDAPLRVRDLVGLLEEHYPPALAEPWDAVGLVLGDPDTVVRRVLLAVDPAEEVAREAVEGGFELLVTHHPLYLRGTTTVAATTPKGRVVQALVTGGCALHVAHTNADNASPGVSDALAALFGLTGTTPLEPGAAPGTGTGRVGELPGPTTLRELVRRAAAVLPPTEQGVRGAGDPDLPVRRLAVVGGAGDAYLAAAARSGAQALLTADLRHHPASERPAGLALVDAAHWATEQPWLEVAARRLRAATSLDVVVSALRTDPWTLHDPSDPSDPGSPRT